MREYVSEHHHINFVSIFIPLYDQHVFSGVLSDHIFRRSSTSPSSAVHLSPTILINCKKMEMADSCWDYGFVEVDTGLVNTQPKSVVIIDDEDCEGSSGTTSAVDQSTPCSTSSERGPPICRQFWQAGNYDDNLAPASKTHVGSSYLHIHPKFLHSNATSHKWAFGAIAELLDNAVDEIRNGATYVMIDKISTPRNGSPALLIQDDGSGMDPEAMRKCMSFGFSDKSESAIGKYGNGFKTSSMRLGADALVFTRTLVDGTLTQSIGLLSYTFLTRSGYDRIVVPTVHYKFNFITGAFESLQTKSDRRSDVNLSVLLHWSPYTAEAELLKQFDDIGEHGTKIIIYNLWLNDDGNMELDFESDIEDIRLALVEKTRAKDGSKQAITDNHLANRLQYSLRAYLSILYVKLPATFSIVLRGNYVLYHNTARDLMHPEFILYKPHKGGGSKEGSVITTIGFLKEAPHVKVHGFNIYHKSRLILPYLPVVCASNGKGQGVVGVLEANFMQPTHSKQDFEKTNLFQKLVTRLKDMAIEYWDTHCELLGYTVPKKVRPSVASGSCPKQQGSNLKRKTPDPPEGSPSITTSAADMDPKKANLMQENKKLKQQCSDLEMSEKELSLKATNLQTVLEEAEKEYASLLTELQRLESVKVWERGVKV
uniref:Putative histidine kinase-like ATPase, C-terminal domain-containing protein n=2 Tax=Helianthus annuus TaxID=4232 RepID=A0A251VFT8_HELAN